LKLYEEYVKQLRELGPHVEIGIFQAEMEVSLINHGKNGMMEYWMGGLLELRLT